MTLFGHLANFVAFLDSKGIGLGQLEEIDTAAILYKQRQDLTAVTIWESKQLNNH